MKKNLQAIPQVMRHAPSLRKLLSEANADHNRLIQLRQMLPAELASHCIDVHLRGSKLVVYLNSPGWASRLRLMTPRIIKSFDVQQVVCRVQPLQAKTPPTLPARQRGAHHSSGAADWLESSSEQYQDREISEAMRRLARAVRPRR